MFRGRYVVLLVFAALYAFAAWGTTTMERQNENEQFFADDHYMATVVTW